MSRPGSGSLARSGVVLAAATTLANLLGYGLVLVLTRTLTRADLGAAGALLNLAIIGMVPAFAVQLVVARAVAADGRATGSTARAVDDLRRPGIRVSLEVSGLLALAVALASPALTTFLHLTGEWDALLVALWLLPATVVFAVQGLLQGAERFLALSAVLVATAAVRPVAGVLTSLVGSGVTGLMAMLTGGTALVALAAVRLVREAPHPADVVQVAASGGPDGTSQIPGRAALRREVAAATVATAGLLTLANVDVLLARNVLSAHDSGAYAVGALFAKGAFWAPQFVSTLLYPRMAGGDRRSRAVLGSLALTAGAGLAAVLVAAAFAEPLVTLVAGSGYRDLAPVVWLFVALGGLLAVAQVLLYARVAVDDRRLGLVSWLTVGLLALAVLTDPAPDVTGVALRALAAVGVLVAAGLVAEREAFLPARRDSTPAVPDPAP